MVSKIREIVNDTVDDKLGENVELKITDKLIWVWEECIPVPGTNFRFGLEPLLAFFPIVGDVLSYLVSCAIAISMIRYGGSMRLALKMVYNISKDFIIGGIPIIGHVYDFAFKANRKNYNLLKEYRLEGKHAEDVSFKKILITTIAIITGTLFLGIIFLVWIGNLIWDLISNLF